MINAIKNINKTRADAPIVNQAKPSPQVIEEERN